MEILIARECLYYHKHDCVIKTYDVIAQLVDAIATRTFPFPRLQEKEGEGSATPH
jgi:hypothetical protein